MSQPYRRPRPATGIALLHQTKPKALTIFVRDTLYSSEKDAAYKIILNTSEYSCILNAKRVPEKKHPALIHYTIVHLEGLRKSMNFSHGTECQD
jgi:hypothetical protein